jgi:hypothetical protein
LLLSGDWIDRGIDGNRTLRKRHILAGADVNPWDICGRSLARGANPNQQMYFRAPRAPGSVSPIRRGL